MYGVVLSKSAPSKREIESSEESAKLFGINTENNSDETGEIEVQSVIERRAEFEAVRTAKVAEVAGTADAETVSISPTIA